MMAGAASENSRAEGIRQLMLQNWTNVDASEVRKAGAGDRDGGALSKQRWKFNWSRCL